MKPYYKDASVTIHHADATALPIPNESVDCIVTSPPYNVGIAYQDVADLMTWEQYGALAFGAAREMYRVLDDGGRAWVNVMPTAPGELTGGTHKKGKWGKKGGHLVARANLLAIWNLALDEAGLSYRDTVVWIQDAWDGACSWGSKWSPNAPNLRGSWEAILLFHKGPWMRGRIGQNDIPRESWSEYTRNVWKMNPSQSSGHPATFPPELPRRCILLSTWPGDTVLDPFCGSGTTIKVAKDLGRKAIGVDLSETYCEMTRRRVAQEVLAL